MPLGDVCVHTGWVVTTVDKVADEDDDDLWLEGEPDQVPVKGPEFDCFYMDPGEQEQNSPASSKKIKVPTILLESERDDGTAITFEANDELDILAEEILGPEPVRFQVQGGPTPLAGPGNLIGWEVKLKRVRGA